MPAPNVVTLFLNPRQIPKVALRGPPGLLRRHSLPNQFVDLLCEMFLNFIGKVEVFAPARKKSAKPIHGRTGDSTQRTPSIICSKLASSRSRCFLPAAVML